MKWVLPISFKECFKRYQKAEPGQPIFPIRWSQELPKSNIQRCQLALLCYGTTICVPNLIHALNKHWSPVKKDETSKYRLINTSARETTQDKQCNDQVEVAYVYIKVSRCIKDIHQRIKCIWLNIFILLLYCKDCPNFIHRN